MALNVALPLAGYGDLLEGFGLLSPISPINTNCREMYKKLISPQGSESSGVSSLDSEEIKVNFVLQLQVLPRIIYNTTIRLVKMVFFFFLENEVPLLLKF
jgi:hypothetical protein